MTKKYAETLALLKKFNQEHVLQFWSQLDAPAQQELLAQVATIDFTELQRMQAVLQSNTAPHTFTPTPAAVTTWDEDSYDAALTAGEKELAQGRVAVLLVAGGQGSRLGYDGPKGAYPIGPLSSMPLFFYHARKVIYLSVRYDHPVPLYVMTSAVNDEATRECFEEYDYFGLDPEQVIFFKQGTWPALDAQGKLILETPGRIFMSPDGHGGTLTALDKNGCLEDMQTRGIQHVFYFQVDNPLVDIADPAFVGLHALEQSEYSLKLCLKRAPDEKMGVVSQLPEGGYALVEYSELTTAQAAQFAYGSPAIHLFALDFLKRMAQQALPLHLAHKQIPYVDAQGHIQKPREPNGYKFEKFIFDALPFAKQVVNLAFDREEEFAPVKNATGEDSPATCQDALQNKWRRWLSAAGISVPTTIPVEIDPAFAMGPEDLAEGLFLG